MRHKHSARRHAQPEESGNDFSKTRLLPGWNFSYREAQTKPLTKVAALVTDGVDAALLKALRAGLNDAGVALAVVAPVVGGVQASDGRWIEADETVSADLSALFDAIAVLVPAEGVKRVANNPAARGFIADAYAHAIFIAYAAKSASLLECAGVPIKLDRGLMALNNQADIVAFVQKCQTLHHRARASRMTGDEHVR